MQDGQVGLSLRAMESIFFNKKYVTTNKEIINEPFYCAENIYVLGDSQDDDEKLQKFLSDENNMINEQFFKYYDFEEWLKRFNY